MSIAKPLDNAALIAQVNAIADLETALVQHVRGALTPQGLQHPLVDVNSWPDKPDSYRLSHPVGAVLVIYQGSKTDVQNGVVRNSLPDKAHTFLLRILARTLRQPNVATQQARDGSGTYQLLQVCELAINGWSPVAGGNPAVVLQSQFIDYSEGVWHYELSLRVPSVAFIPPYCPAGPWLAHGVDCHNAPATARVDLADRQGNTSPNPFIPTKTP